LRANHYRSCALKAKSAELVIGSLAALLALSPIAMAAPLDVAACDAAIAEQGQLSDIPPVLERGPEWAKANATPQVLKRVARWIELQEVISFRCGRGRVTAEAQRAGAAADLIENPPPPPPKDSPAKEAAAAAKDAAAAARDAAAAAKDAAAAASGAVPAGAAGLVGAGSSAPAVKPKTSKAAPKSKLKPDSAAVAPSEAGAAVEVPAVPPVKKKKVAKPADAYVPAAGQAPAGAVN
jgi:hypothetical protein